jgi:hypothetical protein
MKSIHQIYAETADALREKSRKALSEAISANVGGSLEEGIALMEKALQKRNMKKNPKTDLWESCPVRKHNGANTKCSFLFDESDHGNWTPVGADADKVAQYAKEFRVSLREAAIICGLPDPGPSCGQSDDAKRELREAWAPMKGLLKESEIEQLVKRGIRP